MRRTLPYLFGTLLTLSFCLTPVIAQETKTPAEEKKTPAEEKKTPAEEKKTPAEEKKTPADDGLTTPTPGSPEATLIEGLRLVADGKFDQWVERYCHQGKYCRTPQATKSIKRYNLTAAQRLVPYCLKGDKRDKLKITKRVEQGEELRIFLACNVSGMSRPFTLQRDGGAWKFRRI